MVKPVAHLWPVAVEVWRRVRVRKGVHVGVPLQRVLQVACAHIVAPACGQTVRYLAAQHSTS